MGQTDKTQAEFHAFLESISPRFTAFTYNLLENNCNNFSDTVCCGNSRNSGLRERVELTTGAPARVYRQVCQFLVGQGIPSYITGLPREVMSTPFGAMLRPMLDQMQSQIMSIGAEQVGTASGRPMWLSRQFSPMCRDDWMFVAGRKCILGAPRQVRQSRSLFTASRPALPDRFPLQSKVHIHVYTRSSPTNVCRLIGLPRQHLSKPGHPC
jgi:hypothetical protein